MLRFCRDESLVFYMSFEEEYTLETLLSTIQIPQWQQIVMWAIGGLLIYLAIK